MKIQKKSHRKINSITPGRWTAYAAAGAASALTGGNSAEAEIHYSGYVFSTLTGDARVSLPLTNGASLFFENTLGPGRSAYSQNFYFLMKGVISGSARAYYHSGGGWNLLSRVLSGENVSAGRFYSVTGNLQSHQHGIGVLISNGIVGEFAPIFGRLRGFVGFRFNTGKGTQYGWARIQTKNGSNDHVHDIIKDYAWGDPGDVILTGQTQSLEPANANSVASSLGLLAFGAQGLDAWRAQRTQKPTD